MKHFHLFFLSMVSMVCTMGQPALHKDSIAVASVLSMQEQAWNNGDLKSFMEGYWKSDSLIFTGSTGVLYGWKNTFDRYKRTYNSREKMGTLHFQLMHMAALGADYFTVLGEYRLTRTSGENVNGYFTLIFRKFPFGWKIIADHTS